MFAYDSGALTAAPHPLRLDFLAVLAGPCPLVQPDGGDVRAVDGSTIAEQTTESSADQIATAGAEGGGE